MLKKAEEARQVKNMAQCIAYENSWRLSENFNKICKEKCQVDMKESMTRLSMDIKSFNECCLGCLLNVNSQPEEAELLKPNPCPKDFFECERLDCRKSHFHFYPSSSYIESMDDIKRLAEGISFEFWEQDGRDGKRRNG